MSARRTISAHEQIRRQAGLTITELARRACYSRPYVSLVEGGLQKPSPRYRAAIARALGVDEALIFDADDSLESASPAFDRAQGSRETTNHERAYQQ